jgi:predicted dehydrogenase
LIRVGLLGCGRIARVHVPYIRAYKGAEIVGVCDTNREQATAFARQCRIPIAYADPLTLVREQRPDVIHILTPPQTHAQLAEAIMEAGIHVLVEKPMAVTAEEAARMLATAGRAGVQLCVNHNRLFDPVVLKAKRLVADGVLGDVVGVEAFQGFSHTEGREAYYGSAGSATPHWAFGLPGSILQNLAPHSVSLLLAFLPGARAVSVVTRRTGALPGVPFEEVRMLFEGSRALGNLTFSLTPRPCLNFLNLYGSMASLQVNLNNMTLTLWREYPRLPKLLAKSWFNIDQCLQLLTSTLVTGLQVVTGRMSLYPGIGNLIRRYYTCLESGGPPPVTPEEGLEVVSVLDLLSQPAPAASRA